MVKIVRLSRIDLIDGAFDLEALKSAPLCYCEDGLFAEQLRGAGVPVHGLTIDGAPDGATLIIPKGPLYDLHHVVRRLLGPGGCPWDQAQTHESLKRFLLEEAYEVLDAIDSGSDEKLKEELGDL